MTLDSTYDEFVDISYSAHKSSIHELMRLVSTNLYNGKNRSAIIEGEIDISKRGPFQIIPHTDILKKPEGKHSLKFLILSDTGATNTTSSDNLLQCFTPTMIGSRNIIVNNYAGRTGAGVNQYCFKFLTANGTKPIITESVQKPHFSQSKDWTQKELN